MTISLSDAGRRFNREWIFRHFNYQFDSGQSYAIIGPNGSGKSTLLQVLSGALMLTEGKGQWAIGNRQSAIGNQQIDPENVYRYVSICAPYMEVIEEMTAKEFLDFHHGFKPFLPGFDTDQIIGIIGLENAVHKQIRYYSSGMKQRIKLAQCIFSDTPVVLLDEPCTNLDAEGVALYERMIEQHCKTRLVIVSSNDEVEYKFCQNRIRMLDFK